MKVIVPMSHSAAAVLEVAAGAEGYHYCHTSSQKSEVDLNEWKIWLSYC